MEDMEKYLKTYAKMVPLVKNFFEEHQDSLLEIKTDWDKHIVKILHLGENAIQLDK
jgi:hypothetical protein